MIIAKMIRKQNHLASMALKTHSDILRGFFLKNRKEQCLPHKWPMDGNDLTSFIKLKAIVISKVNYRVSDPHKS